MATGGVNLDLDLWLETDDFEWRCGLRAFNSSGVRQLSRCFQNKKMCKKIIKLVMSTRDVTDPEVFPAATTTPVFSGYFYDHSSSPPGSSAVRFFTPPVSSPTTPTTTTTTTTSTTSITSTSKKARGVRTFPIDHANNRVTLPKNLQLRTIRGLCLSVFISVEICLASSNHKNKSFTYFMNSITKYIFFLIFARSRFIDLNMKKMYQNENVCIAELICTFMLTFTGFFKGWDLQ